jgi:hypothetical protein
MWLKAVMAIPSPNDTGEEPNEEPNEEPKNDPKAPSRENPG